MKRAQLWAAGLGAYVLIVIVTAPATLVDAVLQGTSEGRLRLAEAHGTVWSGTGQFEILDTRRQTGMGKELTWHILPGSLLRGRLTCEVEMESGAQHFPMTIFPTRIEVSNAEVSAPAAVLGYAIPKLGPLGLGGDLLAKVTDLAIGRGGAHANATVQWRAASSVYAPVSPLGDYELRLVDSGTAMMATLSTLAGPLQLDGAGSWTYGAAPAFKATARVSPQQRAQLEPFLRTIAVEHAGIFEFELH